jgi:uncharacterized protein (DUF885 family)
MNKTRKEGFTPFEKLINMNPNKSIPVISPKSINVVKGNSIKKINQEEKYAPVTSIFKEKIELKEPILNVVSFDYTEKGAQYLKITNDILANLYAKMNTDQKSMINQSKNINRFVLSKDEIEDMETGDVETYVSIKDTLKNNMSPSILYNEKNMHMYTNAVAFLNTITRYGNIVNK